MEEGGASGVELLEDFARELEVEATFVEDTVPELLDAARLGEIDVLVGGFTSTFPGVSEGCRKAGPRPRLEDPRPGDNAGSEIGGRGLSRPRSTCPGLS
jgi:hypothetical protein